MSLHLQIKDNFFNRKEYNILVNNLNKINFAPNNDGLNFYAGSHFFKPTEENKWLFDKVKKQFFPNIDLEIAESRFDMRHNKDKVLAHTDQCVDYIFFIYLRGEELVYNGTGFYHNKNLNTYIGFVENRALFFNTKDNWHTDLQALGESSPRFTLNIGYNKN
jgi:hypothetical protein